MPVIDEEEDKIVQYHAEDLLIIPAKYVYRKITYGVETLFLGLKLFVVILFGLLLVGTTSCTCPKGWFSIGWDASCPDHGINTGDA